MVARDAIFEAISNGSGRYTANLRIIGKAREPILTIGSIIPNITVNPKALGSRPNFSTNPQQKLGLFLAILDYRQRTGSLENKDSLRFL